MTEQGTRAPKNLVICCDGTGNEPRATGNTNIFEIAGLTRAKSDGAGIEQRVYYDPGLGTESDPAAQTLFAKAITKGLGLAFGYGLRKNLADAYQFLMGCYEPGDRIFLFGFSRGAYTVRALAGMLQAVGLLEPGSLNLLPYTIKVYTRQTRQRDWELDGKWKSTFCRDVSDETSSSRYAVPVRYLGVFDTVKSVGWFRKRIQLPFTRDLRNVHSGRHAISLDEKRSQYRPLPWSARGDVDGEIRAMWFRGVHSDVGGGYGDAERGWADVALRWVVAGAVDSGLVVDQVELEARCQARLGSCRLEGARRLAAAASSGPDAKWRDLASQLEKARTWTKRLEARFAEADLKVEAAEIESSAWSGYHHLHDPLRPFWWILGWKKRSLPARAWVDASVLEELQRVPGRRLASALEPIRQVGGDRPTALISNGAGTARVALVRVEMQVDARQPAAAERSADVSAERILIQTLTEAEATALGNELPNEPSAALRALRRAGITAWRAELESQLVQAVLDDDADRDAQKKAELRQILELAQQAIEEGKIKGAGGALDLLAGFLRKRTLSREQEAAIESRSPHLIESLAEEPPSPIPSPP